MLGKGGFNFIMNIFVCICSGVHMVMTL